MRDLSSICRHTPAGLLDHDWRTRRVTFDPAGVEEEQECACCGLVRTLHRSDPNAAHISEEAA